MRHPLPAAALIAVLPLTLAACTDGDPGAEPEPDTTSATASPTPSGSATPSGDPSPEESGRPGDLDWKPVPGSTDAEATVSGPWTLTVDPSRGGATLEGPERIPVPVPDDYKVSSALIDGQYAVVAAEHSRGEQPDVATVVELDNGRTSRLDRTSDIPTTVGGSWALGSGLLVHATTSGRDYCLAVVDLAAGRSERGPCVGPREGISNVRLTPAGITAMTFDDSRPSCRTLNRVEGTEFQPLRGVEDCHGWEAVTTETSAVWGVVTNERQVEEAQYVADSGSGRVELGVGTTGTLTWCGGSTYLVRDPQRKSDPARLLRVTPDGTEVVYESPGHGNAFLTAPRCGGTDLTVTAFSAAGDEQVTAPVG